MVFSAGERQGNIIRLYYDAYGSFLGDQLVDSWACVTLEDRGNGQYWFVSHQLCNMPAIPTAYPDWEAVLTLPVSGLTAYEPEAVQVTVHSGDLDEELDFYLCDQVMVEIYRSTDGNTYAAYAPASALLATAYDGDLNCFFTFPEEAENHISIGGFRDVLGYDGVVISYQDQLPGKNEVGTVSDYYIFDEGIFSDGAPSCWPGSMALPPISIWTATVRRSCAPPLAPQLRYFSRKTAGSTRRTWRSCWRRPGRRRSTCPSATGTPPGGSCPSGPRCPFPGRRAVRAPPSAGCTSMGTASGCSGMSGLIRTTWPTTSTLRRRSWSG